MIKEILSISIGIALGCVIVYAGFLFLKKYKKKIEEEKRKQQIYDVFKQKLNKLKEDKRVYDTVESSDLTEWFKKNIEGLNNNIKMVIAIPTEEVLKSLNYMEVQPEDIDKDKNLIQLIYNTKTQKVLKISLISFNNIESVFQSKLLENDGVLIITK